jgi:hypothetical protein
MRIACWVPKPTNKTSEYVTIIVFPLQQWLHESVSMLRHMYTACTVISIVVLIIHLIFDYIYVIYFQIFVDITFCLLRELFCDYVGLVPL